MLNREARCLASVAYEHPEKALTILGLIDGYKDMALQVESGSRGAGLNVGQMPY
jgi:hypothetical protein